MIADSDVLISRISDQLSVELDGEIAILNLKSKMYFGLTDVGAFIWNLLEEPSDLAGVANAVIDQFEVDIERALADTERLLAELESAGLVQLERVREAPTDRK